MSSFLFTYIEWYNKFFRPKKDPLVDPRGHNLTGGFGDALTAALDVMAFTHELDINSAAHGLNLANNVVPPSKQETKVCRWFELWNEVILNVFSGYSHWDKQQKGSGY